MREKVLFAWSGGKDSAMALYELKTKYDYEILALLTTITEGYDRISMHGVRRILLEQQANFLGIPLERVFISKSSSNEEYESKMREALTRYMNRGVSTVVFGDIFLEDLRRYREDNLSKIGMKGMFPIWKQDTAQLARAFIDLGFKAVVTCIDSNILDKRFVGRRFDHKFLSELPPSVDPCGENGEFHTFVYDGPIFQKGISYETGEIVLRNGHFYYCDLVPVQNEPACSER
ncbi:MAG: diphthine--ammonia ligase [Candidatus Omnitrophica bacterium]|nr:diphthine--ammonia ligase [Candidatus Omnitrophota bacterium]